MVEKQLPNYFHIFLYSRLTEYCEIFEMTKNVTISITDELADEMLDYSEVKWSEICRRAIINYIQTRKGRSLVPFSEREEKINGLVEFMRTQSGWLKDDLIAHFCAEWLYAPSEVTEILSIAVGGNFLSEAVRKNGERYIIYLSWPRGIGAQEFINYNKIREEMNKRSRII